MIDGPYIYDINDDKFEVLNIKKNFDEIVVERSSLDKKKTSTFQCYVDGPDGDFFDVNLKNKTFLPPPAIYENVARIFVLSDIEGNFYAFERLLKSNGVIDENYNWSFGNGHLVLNGDFVDRGKNVIPLLWLIYKLEFQAVTEGGQVHFILGNHEDFFVTGNIKYVNPKYLEIAKAATKIKDSQESFEVLNNEYFLLRKWMLSKNTIEKIGTILFVHGGISTRLCASGLSIQDINRLVRKGMPRVPIAEKELLPLLELLFGSYGPLWYRGFVFDYKDYKKEPERNIEKVLDYFGVSHIVIGHNMVDEVSSDYNKKLYRIDVDQSHDKFSGNVHALSIEDGKFYRVDDKGAADLI